MQTSGRPLSRLAKAGYVAFTVMVVAVVAASLGAYAIYRRLDGNVSVVRVSGLSHRSVYGAQNILLLGSQTRQGQRAGDLGSNPALNTSNSDNLLLAQTGRPGPVTLIIGSDFAGVNAPSARQRGSGGKGQPGHSAPSAAAQTAVQSRNAGASICSGLPAANPSPGVP
jgi:hypothetical protein